MTTINDQPQHLLARYADRTGCKRVLTWSKAAPAPKRYPPISAAEEVSNGATIEIVLSEYGLPSHLKPYKDNPRLPGDGYRVPVEGESSNQPCQFWADDSWIDAIQVEAKFSDNLLFDQRLRASVLPPDWEEMTREDVPTVATADTSPHPEIFEAHGLEWYRHDGSVNCPCDPNIKVEWLSESELKSGVEYSALVVVMRASEMSWSGVHVWRPADAPAKLPRPEQQPQDEVQALKARVQELEGELSLKNRHIERLESRLDHVKKCRQAEAEQNLELCAAASTPTLRPIAEMPDTVPEGCVRVYGNKEHTQHGMKFWGFHQVSQQDIDTHFLDIRLPAPPDPDEELRREWEKLFSHSDALTQIRKSLTEEQVSISFQAFKAGRAKEGAR